MSKFKMTPIAKETLEGFMEDKYSLEEISGMGICYECGATRDEVEPDAEGYECYDCGLYHVVGIETALLELI